MKYFHLVWAALFRRKTRTIFTLISILAAFLLFDLLNAVRAAFTSGSNSLAGNERLVNDVVARHPGHPKPRAPTIALSFARDSPCRSRSIRRPFPACRSTTATCDFPCTGSIA
jgi:hypothetical protein